MSPVIQLQDSMPLTYTLTERVGETDGRVVVHGKFQHCDIPNRNGRIYPAAVWRKALSENSDFIKAIRENKVFGHLEHPQDGRSDLNKAAIKLVNVKLEDDGRVMGDIQTLSTPAGQIAAALFKDRLTIGISSRGRGSVVKNSKGLDEVQDDFQPDTFDLVAEPSTPGASLTSESTASKYIINKFNALTEDVKRAAPVDIALVIIQERLAGLERCGQVSPYALGDLRYEVKSALADVPARIVLPILERLFVLEGKCASGCACTTKDGCAIDESALDVEFHLAQLRDYMEIPKDTTKLQEAVAVFVNNEFRHLPESDATRIIAAAVKHFGATKR